MFDLTERPAGNIHPADDRLPRDENPRDCVTELELSGGVVQLIAWDRDGRAGLILQGPRGAIRDEHADLLLQAQRDYYAKTHSVPTLKLVI